MKSLQEIIESYFMKTKKILYKDITIPDHLNEYTFESVLKESSSDLIILYDWIYYNFENTNFVNSFAAALFIILCERLVYEDNKRVCLRLPDMHINSKEKDCCSILNRLGFFDCLPNEIMYLPEKPINISYLKGSNSGFLEITKLMDRDDAFELIDLAENTIQKNTHYPEDQINDITRMLSEIIQNIFIHSEFKKPSMFAIQRYPKIQTLHLVIADSGIGIPATLRRKKKYQKYEYDYMLIERSLRSKVSQYEDIEVRGEGLDKCRAIARKHKATVYIRSNHGILYLDYSRKYVHFIDSLFLSGTQFFINFPMN